MTYTIYHNPRCSKSRQTLALLKENSIEATVIEYLKNPPSTAELAEILQKLGKSPRDIIRTKEALYKEQGVNDQSLSDQQILEKLHEFPKLIERPIVVCGDKAVIGRPPENVLALIND